MEQMQMGLIGVSIALCCMAYFTIGIGVARMVGQIKTRPIHLLDVWLWWIVTSIFAVHGDIK